MYYILNSRVISSAGEASVSSRGLEQNIRTAAINPLSLYIYMCVYTYNALYDGRNGGRFLFVCFVFHFLSTLLFSVLSAIYNFVMGRGYRNAFS